MSAPVHITSRPLSADELMGRAAMNLRSRLKTFPVIEGGRRMLADRTPGRADLKLVEKEN